VQITSIDPFLEYLESARSRTRRTVLCIPPADLEWAHMPGRFTLGDIVRHLGAIERWMFAENACGRPSRYPGHGRDLADGFDATVGYFDRMHAESVEIFGTLTPEQLAGRCVTPAGSSIPVWKWLRAMLEHEAHHRGQLHMMLSMRGVKAPPLFGLTEEEVRARSAS
jgi:uncharacterized damage-inducible protein DinB